MGDEPRDARDNPAAPARQAGAAGLIEQVYGELRALAQSYLARERPDHTLQATALVHEAFLRLADQQNANWKSRAHFFAVAAQAIRRILVDHARARARLKRGAARERLTLDDALAWKNERDVDLLALEEAIARLAALSERQARIVELRFFGGLSVEEAADVLEVSTRTIEVDWRMARWFLAEQLQKGDLC